MRSRTRLAFAVAVLGVAALAEPAFGVPLPRERHVPLHHKPQTKPRPAERTALRVAPAPSPLSQLSLSARTSYAVPALVAEARKYMGTNPTDRKRLWCATFMNFVLAKLGYAGTNSDAAKSFAYYGRRIGEPRVGAIAVLSRGRRGGHVGVVSGIDKDGDPVIISGNHNRKVGEAVYPRSRVIAYVMPTEQHAATRVAAAGPVSLPAAEAGLDSPITELIAAIEAEQAHAETPKARHEARAVRVASAAHAARASARPVAPPVPHRVVQQLPEVRQQASGRRRTVGADPFSALVAEIERTPRQSARR